MHTGWRTRGHGPPDGRSGCPDRRRRRRGDGAPPGGGRRGIAPGASSARFLARAGLIVTGMFLLSRVLGYVRTIVFASAFPGLVELDPFYRGLPDPGPHVPARRRWSPVVGADPRDRRAVRQGGGCPRLARGLDGHDPDALGPDGAGGDRPVVRARAHRGDHAGLQRRPAGPDDGPDQDHGPRTGPARGGSHRNERPQLPRAVRGRGARAPRLQPRDDLRGHRARAGLRGAGPGLWRGARSGGAHPGADPGPRRDRGAGSGRSSTSATTRRGPRCC